MGLISFAVHSSVNGPRAYHYWGVTVSYRLLLVVSRYLPGDERVRDIYVRRVLSPRTMKTNFKSDSTLLVRCDVSLQSSSSNAFISLSLMFSHKSGMMHAPRKKKNLIGQFNNLVLDLQGQILHEAS